MTEGKFHHPFEGIDIKPLTQREKEQYDNIDNLVACVHCHGKKVLMGLK
jgi:hypothetical protein